jgi:hypothetical protein
MGTRKTDQREPSKPDAEVRPDAWRRFERAVDAAVKSGPKHRMPEHHKHMVKKHRETTAKTRDKSKSK